MACKGRQRHLLMLCRRHALVCLLILGANAGLPVVQEAGGSALVRPLAWIRPSNDKRHFVYEGTNDRFVAWGFNYDHDHAGRLLEDDVADEGVTVAEDFREMKAFGANTVRIHLQLARFMKAPDQPDEQNLARLARLVGLGGEHGP